MKIIFNFLSEQEDHNAVSSAPVVKRVLFFCPHCKHFKKVCNTC